VECIIHFCVVLWFVVVEGKSGGEDYRKRSRPVECAKEKRKGIIAERQEKREYGANRAKRAWIEHGPQCGGD
jgi:hypothetical protein